MSGASGKWVHSDLTHLTGAPLAEGSALAGYAWEASGTRQVMYGSGDGHIHELTAGKSGNWSHSDLTQLTGAPPAEGPALADYVWAAGGSRQVVYMGSDRHIYELVADGSGAWTYGDLMRLTGAPLAEGSALAGMPGKQEEASRWSMWDQIGISMSCHIVQGARGATAT